MAGDNFRESALEAFRSKKVIVISGPRGSGKTTLALSLLSSYQDGHYLILTEPDDLRCVRFGVTCVVIIEDLGGKYMFEMSVIQKWLRKFDMLYSAVKDGKLNVIITCLTDRLSLCVHESKHQMLETVIELPKYCTVKIKKESSTDFHSIVYAAKSINAPSYNRVKKIETHKIDLRVHDYAQTETFCLHPDGSFLVLAVASVVDDDDDHLLYHLRYKIVVFQISSDFEYQCYYNTDTKVDLDYITDICCTDTGNVVISVQNQIRLYRIYFGSLQLIKSLESDVNYDVSNISFHKNRIYCFFELGSSLILDTNLIIKRSVKSLKSYIGNIVPRSLQRYIGIVLHDYMEDMEEVCYDCIVCEDSILKELKYLSKEGFKPVCLCTASDEDSVFVFGKQADDFKVLRVNTDMVVLLEICITQNVIESGYYHTIVFDKDNSRLVLISGDDSGISLLTIYLE